MEGSGAYFDEDNSVLVCRFRAGSPVGDGVRWSADRRRAWRMSDGEPRGEMPLEEARAAAARLSPQDFSF